MGVVFEAVNVATDGRVAIKMLKPSLDGGERASRMGREARASAKLRSRFVARVLDFDCTKDDGPVLVMELLEGHDLSAELRRTPILSVDDTLSYIVQACAGVGEAHALGIIHRDLKPGNLFLEAGAGPPLVRMLDFGLSKDLATERGEDLTSPSDALGTLGYMSPEQMRATKDVGPPTDVWALGVVLYRCLTGSLPLTGKAFAITSRLLDARPMPRVEREGVSRELADVIACALEKEPARRFPDARALGRALRPFVRHPSPPTKLAFVELASDVRPIAEPDDPTEASTTRTVVVSNALDDRTSIMPGPSPRRRKRRRNWFERTTQETRMVLAGAAILVLATILIAATSDPKRGSSVAPSNEPRSPPSFTPPIVTAPPPAPSASTPRPRLKPQPRF